MNPRRILPPSLFWITLALMVMLRWAWPVAIILGSPFNLAGLIPLGAGFLIMLSAWNLFRQAQTNLNPFNAPDRFVRAGPYRYSRNPMYLGLALMLAGVWLLLGALSPLVGIVGFVLLIERGYIAFEEGEMLAKFGQEYADYQASTRRWL